MEKAPQIIWLILMAIGLLLSANKHGKDRTGKENFWSTLVAVIISFSILYWGGFFNNLN